MFSITIQHGNFKLTIKSYSHLAHIYMLSFLDHLPLSFILVDSQDVQASLAIITDDVGMDLIDQESLSFWTALHRAWKGMESSWKGSSLLQLSRSEFSSMDFVYLVKSNYTVQEVFPLIVHYVFLLEKIWLLQQNMYLIHASGVVSRQKGFLFFGKSGAGKSTITHLSQEYSNTILHDDKILVTQEEKDFYIMRLSNDNVFEDKSLLTSIFLLKQDTRDYLAPIRNLDKVHELMDGYLEVSGNLLSSQKIIKNAFEFLSDLARTVPGYELHFRKSSDFWKLIDERFPDQA